MSNQNYVIAGTSASFTVPDFTVGDSSCILTYTNTVSATGTFITNGNGSGKTFSWYTADNAMAGTYAIKVIGLVGCRSVEMTFNLVVINPCASAVLTIDDTIFISEASGFTITQSIWQPTSTLTWTDAIVSVKDTSGNVISCGALLYEFLNSASTSFASTSEISYDITAKTFSMQTNLPAKVA